MAEHKHRFADIAGGMLDQILCSCGWESATYFDGAEYAYNEWKKHVLSADERAHSSTLCGPEAEGRK